MWLCALATNAYATTERPDLEAKLPTVQRVFCADSTAEWDTLAPFAVAYTWMEGPLLHQIYLSAETCVDLADRDRPGFADAAQTLLHEWFHAEFMMYDEGEVECHSLFIYRYALRHFWGVPAYRAQSFYKTAFEAHVRLGRAWPQYRGDCVYPQPDVLG